MWHEECITCGDIIDIGWVARHRRTHEAESRLIEQLKPQVPQETLDRWVDMVLNPTGTADNTD